MRTGDLLRESFSALSGSRSRTLLTSTGITVGTLALTLKVRPVETGMSQHLARHLDCDIRVAERNSVRVEPKSRAFALPDQLAADPGSDGGSECPGHGQHERIAVEYQPPRPAVELEGAR